MAKLTKFSKYIKQGADYHYQLINKLHFLKFNSYLLARYEIIVKEITDYVNEKLKGADEIKILDVGCGDGVLLFLLQEKLENSNIKFFGVDSSGSALEVARKKVKSGKFIKSDIKKLGFKDSFFDIVISSDVIEHLASPRLMLGEIKRVAKKRAFIIIGTPIRISEYPLDSMHYHEYFPNEFESLIKKLFADSTVIQSHPLIYYLLYQKRIFIFKYAFAPFRYLFNIICLFIQNPFLKTSKVSKDIFSYMYASCLNDK